MRRSNSQPALAIRAVSDRDALEEYSAKELAKRRTREALATERARDLEQQLRQRRSSIHSFSEARPLSRSEAKSLQEEEARLRREARLLQVREKERVNAALRRQEYDQARKAAARKVAASLERDYEIGMRRMREAGARRTDYPSPSRQVTSNDLYDSELETELEEKVPSFYTSRRGSSEKIFTESKRSERRHSMDHSSPFEDIGRPKPHRQASLFAEPERPSGYPSRPVLDPRNSPRFNHLRQPRMSRKISDEDFLDPDDQDTTRGLWKLYEDFERQQQRWSRVRDKLSHYSPSRIPESSAVNASGAPVRRHDYNEHQRYEDRWHFLDEGGYRSREYKEEDEEKQLERTADSPSRRRSAKAEEDRIQKNRIAQEVDAVDLAPDDVIVLTDDGFLLERAEGTHRDENLASTTWFAMAEEELSSEHEPASPVRTSSSSSVRNTDSKLRSASRLPLDSVGEEPRREPLRGESPARVASAQKAQPSPERLATLERLRRGERPRVSRREMLARTERAVKRLPEVSEQRKEVLKREEAERRRRLVLEFNQKRRASIMQKDQHQAGS